MEFILGFIIMIVLTVISSIPIFILLKLKNTYSNVLAWVLFVVCAFIYILLKVTCIEFGILNGSKGMPVPLIAMFVIYFLSRLGVAEVDTKSKK